MTYDDLADWVDAIHQASLEMPEDKEGLYLWWLDTVEHGPEGK